MRCDAKGNGERWQEALPLWRTYLQRSLQRFGKHGISMSCYSRLDFSRDFHKSNFRETGKLWLLSMRTDRYVMWYGAIIAATGYIFCYYYYCCCRRRRHRRRYCYNCCCFSCSISRKKTKHLIQCNYSKSMAGVQCTVARLYNSTSNSNRNESRSFDLISIINST